MKTRIILFCLAFLLIGTEAFSQTDRTSQYFRAMKFYDNKDYAQAAKTFDLIDKLGLSSSKLYAGACIYALNNEKDKAFTLLYVLADKQYYSNYNHLQTDPDLTSIRNDPKWAPLLAKVKENNSTSGQRKLATIYTELNKAKQILEKDAGKLWGFPIWNDNIFVLDFDNKIYAIKAFPGSQTDDGRLFYAHVPANTFVFVNTVQSFQGKDYAVVLSNYLADHSITIIHELFHLVQLQQMKLNGDAIKYLDNYDARELLRLEYQALRNTLSAINDKSPKLKTVSYLEDALLFRKLRQGKYSSFLQSELEIETLEGLANYTGFALSASPNKYDAAIEEIYGRENAETYTRPFPYATGVAYGLIFDQLGISWKQGLKKVYNFLEIYENGHPIDTGSVGIAKAKARNNFDEIHLQEEARRIKNDSLLAYYNNLLQAKPTLKAIMSDKDYGRTFNMNGTIEMPGVGTVYSSIKGRDKSGKNFGSFATTNGKDHLGSAGILMLNDFRTFLFPTPFKVTGNKIIGETYEIELNEGWYITEADDKGNYLIKQKN